MFQETSLNQIAEIGFTNLRSSSFAMKKKFTDIVVEFRFRFLQTLDVLTSPAYHYNL